MNAIMCMPLTVAALASVSIAAPDDDDVSALRQHIESLQSQVNELRHQAGDDSFTQQRSEEIRALVQEVLADADVRGSFLQSGVAAGYDGGFFIRATDGSYSLKINGQLQFRYVYNTQDDNAIIDGHRQGFEMRRTKLKFKGNVVDSSWHYAINGAFSNKTGVFMLEDAEITKKFGNGWQVRVGQFKGPFMREELISSSRQLAVDRTLVNEFFNQDRSQGVELGYSSDAFRFKLLYSDGFNSDNTPALVRDTEAAFTGRAEFLAKGNWKQFKDFTSWNGEEFGAMFGIAAHYQRGEFGSIDLETEAISLTADASLEFGGSNLFAAVVYRSLETPGSVDLHQYGIVAQGGVLFTDDVEGFLRYEWGDDDSMNQNLSVITLGVNKYFKKHGLKWTTDIGVGLNEVSGAWDSSGVGWRADGAGLDTQIVFRSQLQLLF